MIITDLIDHYLKNKIFDRASFSGLDGAGKTYHISPLIGKYEYFKTNWVTPYLTPLRFMRHYKIFDRNPIIDRWVYTNLDKIDFEYTSVDLTIELLKKYFDNTIFIQYLHDRYRSVKPDEPSYVDNNRDEILKRFRLITEKMIESGLPVIVIENNSFRKYN